MMNGQVKVVPFISIVFFLLISTSVFAGSVHYTYDNLNRVIRAVYDDGTAIEYTYDASGNRITKEVRQVDICECVMVPDATVVPRGSALGFGVTLTNNTDQSQTVYFATKVKLPNGSMYPPSGYLFGPYPVTLSPYQSGSGHLSQTIPNSAPVGIYTYYGYVGNPADGIMDEDQFDFEVTSVLTMEGSEDWEITVDGEFAE